MVATERIERARQQLAAHMEKEWLPFWQERGCDWEFGGYNTSFDGRGNPMGDGNKYIVTQARMIWSYSALFGRFPDQEAFRAAAAQGVDFMLKYFWDREFGGWIWATDRAGNAVDRGKVVYGESFMLYALAQYGVSTGDPRGREYASKTFDLLQKYAADTARGGYYENLEPDWSISAPGYAAGDRKSLDVHMHLLEGFTTLCELTGEEIHRRKLNEVIDVILNRMTDAESGCGRNQFAIAFHPVPAISIRRTWNDDRGKGEVIPEALDTTSYGHNMELSWLLNRAARVLSDAPDRFFAVTKLFLEHTLKYGLDNEFGGVYRDGPHQGPALVRDKEWWQNCEVLIGFLDAYQALGDERCFDAFEKCWAFDNRYMIDHEVGEWRQLLSRSGDVLIADMGNPWKAMYHTGRALLECTDRLDRLQRRLSQPAAINPNL